MQRALCITAILSLCIAAPVYALYSVSDRGEWPESWPAEMESLRRQSRTFVGPILHHRHFAVPFTKRTDFESVWPQVLKVKSQGAPIFLVRGSNFFLKDAKAGVVIHEAPLGPRGKPARPEEPIESANLRERWMYTTYIEVLVDGEIIDLNRIQLPGGSPIVDERFENQVEPTKSRTSK
jgi:hypothetical protein